MCLPFGPIPGYDLYKLDNGPYENDGEPFDHGEGYPNDFDDAEREEEAND